MFHNTCASQHLHSLVECVPDSTSDTPTQLATTRLKEEATTLLQHLSPPTCRECGVTPHLDTTSSERLHSHLNVAPEEVTPQGGSATTPTYAHHPSSTTSSVTSQLVRPTASTPSHLADHLADTNTDTDDDHHTADSVADQSTDTFSDVTSSTQQVSEQRSWIQFGPQFGLSDTTADDWHRHADNTTFPPGYMNAGEVMP